MMVLRGSLRQFPSTSRRWRETRGRAILDAAGVVSSSDDDGVHLDAEAHAAFGNAIAEWIRTLI
jgi:lysophospholipase L1-like esterase